MLAFQFCNRWLMGDTQRHLLSFGCHVAWYVTATLLQRGCQEMDIKRVGAQKKGAGVETGVLQTDWLSTLTLPLLFVRNSVLEA